LSQILRNKIDEFTENYETKEKIKIKIENAIDTERENVNSLMDKTKNLCKELIDLNK